MFKFCFFFFITISLFSQTKISGKIMDNKAFPVESAIIIIGENSSTTDNEGYFMIEIPETENINIKVQKEDYETIELQLSGTQHQVINLQLNPIKIEKPVIVFGKKQTDIMLNSYELQSFQTNLNSGVISMINTLPGVSSYSELSSQYMVRGGNYDENLVYINGMEIYKPQLIRSGQEEGMSIINSQMVSKVNFSSGGFEAAFGDKMSSVLDVIYHKPVGFELAVEGSLLGGALTLGWADKKQKFSTLIGGRYRNTDLILNTLDGDTDFNPEYIDIQSVINYQFNPKWAISFFGAMANNQYNVIPKTKQVTFGTINNPLIIDLFYKGYQNNQYENYNASLNLLFRPNKTLKFNLASYIYHSSEQEFSNIQGTYYFDLGTDDEEGEDEYGTGYQQNYIDNDLDIVVSGVQLKTKWDLTDNSFLEAGILFQKELLKDRIFEIQAIDSIGDVLHYNEEFPFTNSVLGINYKVQSALNLDTQRINAFAQYIQKVLIGENKLYINAGIRMTYWDWTQETNVSPRVQFALQPNWENYVLFRLAGGLYVQPPFYKELRYLTGELNPDIKSQKSLHLVLGNDIGLTIWKRPFKLTTELYYKSLTDIIPFYIDNVRTIYTGQNNAKGRSYGIDMRLNGEFVKGTESWFSFSYGKSQENIDNQGYIDRPTDPRFKVGAYFSDYMPIFPSMKASITAIYASGLPNGAPLWANPYDFQTKLPDYKRVDIALTNVFIDQKNKPNNRPFWKKFKELSLGLEIFNVFDIRNTVNNQWIFDVNQTVFYAVPNRLTGRFFNIKLMMKF